MVSDNAYYYSTSFSLYNGWPTRMMDGQVVIVPLAFIYWISYLHHSFFIINILCSWWVFVLIIFIHPLKLFCLLFFFNGEGYTCIHRNICQFLVVWCQTYASNQAQEGSTITQKVRKLLHRNPNCNDRVTLDKVLKFLVPPSAAERGLALVLRTDALGALSIWALNKAPRLHHWRMWEKEFWRKLVFDKCLTTVWCV